MGKRGDNVLQYDCRLLTDNSICFYITHVSNTESNHYKLLLPDISFLYYALNPIKKHQNVLLKPDIAFSKRISVKEPLERLKFFSGNIPKISG